MGNTGALQSGKGRGKRLLTLEAPADRGRP